MENFQLIRGLDFWKCLPPVGYQFFYFVIFSRWKLDGASNRCMFVIVTANSFLFPDLITLKVKPKLVRVLKEDCIKNGNFIKTYSESNFQPWHFWYTEKKAKFGKKPWKEGFQISAVPTVVEADARKRKKIRIQREHAQRIQL